jgi:hypothetical protein
MRPLLIMATLAASLYGADGLIESSQLRGPQLGLFLDTSNAVRPVIGIPGSSFIARAIDLGPDLRVAAVSPGGERILGTVGGELVCVRPGQEGVQKISKLDGAIERVVFSPSGSAALIAAAGGWRVLRDLNGSPSLAEAVTMPPDAAAVAINDRGDNILAAAKEGEGSAVVLVEPDGHARRIFTARGAIAIDFLTNSRDAVIGDSVEGKLYLLRDGAELIWVADVAGLLQVATTPDNARALVTQSGSSTITAVNLRDGTLTSSLCACQPAGIERMRDGVFRITAAGHTPMWVVKLESGSLRTAFVPKAEAVDE